LRRAALFPLLVLLATAGSFAATLPIVPTTTLAAETGNNTSASSLFLATGNGNLGSGNVSKVSTRTLMYPGYSGKIYAHLMSWFCMTPGSTSTGAGTQCGSHVQVGYNSNDAAVVHDQAVDMMSRGFDGVIHDWYGPNNSRDDLATRNWLAEAELHPGFQFALMIDQGALKWYSCISTGCSPTQAMIQMTQYAAQNFFGSPAYMRINGRPVLTNFDIDLHYTVDWNAVAANTPGNPIFLFQNNGGFTHVLSAGSYSWVMPTASNYGLDYLGSFYSTGMNYPAELTVGATYKGFNDTLASWSGNRVMSQQCGQTWLQSFAKANSMYNTSQQLGAVQLVTWDDYEEGTELETGIDNCVSLSPAMAGNVLKWTISGNENTIDHYTVFISTDGQNLMPLGEFAVGTSQLDLATYALAPGMYTLYVKATGKPSLRNQMSGAVSYNAVTSGVYITSPTGGATVASPVHVTAYAQSAYPITAIVAYLDYNEVYRTTASSVDTSLTMAAGQHLLVTNAWDTTGKLMQAQLTFTVAAFAPVAKLSVSQTSALSFTASTAASTDPNGSALTSTINWGDGTNSAGPTATHTYAKAGVYTVTARVTDAYGLSSSTSTNVTANGVVIWLPQPGTASNSPVHVSATAYDSRKIASMIVYVDGVNKYLIYANSLDTNIIMSKHRQHTIVINAWEDVTGAVFQSSTTVNVP
jgi:PKD domain